MSPENFVYWIQGWIELQNPETINATQIQEIKNHLSLVLKKETPYLTVYPNIQHYSFQYTNDHLCGYHGNSLSPYPKGTCGICDERNAKTEEWNKAHRNTVTPSGGYLVNMDMPHNPYYSKYTEDNQFVEFPLSVNCQLKGHGTIPGAPSHLLTKELEECYTTKLDKIMGLKPVFSAVEKTDTVTVPVVVYKNDGWYQIDEDEVQKKYVGPGWYWKDPERHVKNFGHWPNASC